MTAREVTSRRVICQRTQKLLRALVNPVELALLGLRMMTRWRVTLNARP
jgi:hypothetical protein